MESDSQARGGTRTGEVAKADPHIPTVRAAGNRPRHATPPTSGDAAAVTNDGPPPPEEGVGSRPPGPPPEEAP